MNAGEKNMKQITCPRCHGEGTIKEYSFNRNGLCFKCSGSGKIDYRKPVEKKIDETYYFEQMIKMSKAMALYENDKRLRVSNKSPWFYMHATELAKLDGVWENL
jgi:DnaJ-class molecular chaperone